MFGDQSPEHKAFVMDYIQRLLQTSHTIIEGGNATRGIKVLHKIDDFITSFSFHRILHAEKVAVLNKLFFAHLS
jgi:hypothetical protein